MSSYAAIIEGSNDSYSGYVPDLPGCVASGASVDEVETPLRAAIGMHIENLREHGEPRAGANCCGSDGQRRPTTEVNRARVRPTLRTGGIPGAGPGQSVSAVRGRRRTPQSGNEMWGPLTRPEPAGRVIPRIGGADMAESVYKVIELVGTSTESWEAAASAAVQKAGSSLRDLRVAEVSELDLQIENGAVKAYRAKVKVSFKYED